MGFASSAVGSQKHTQYVLPETFTHGLVTAGGGVLHFRLNEYESNSLKVSDSDRWIVPPICPPPSLASR